MKNNETCTQINFFLKHVHKSTGSLQGKFSYLIGF
jgi:hypothetical protein